MGEPEPLQFSQYECDDHYNWHIDSHFNPYTDGLIRKLSFSVILNTDYTGGELIIFDENEKNPKKHDIKNKFFTFNGSIYPHETAAFKGERFTIVFY